MSVENYEDGLINFGIWKTIANPVLLQTALYILYRRVSLQNFNCRNMNRLRK